MHRGQQWSISPPNGGNSIPPRERFEIAAAAALLAAAVVFAFTVVPGQPYLMLVTAPWIGVATYLLGLGHSRRTRAE